MKTTVYVCDGWAVPWDSYDPIHAIRLEAQGYHKLSDAKAWFKDSLDHLMETLGRAYPDAELAIGEWAGSTIEGRACYIKITNGVDKVSRAADEIIARVAYRPQEIELSALELLGEQAE